MKGYETVCVCVCGALTQGCKEIKKKNKGRKERKSPSYTQIKGFNPTGCYIMKLARRPGRFDWSFEPEHAVYTDLSLTAPAPL